MAKKKSFQIAIHNKTFKVNHTQNKEYWEAAHKAAVDELNGGYSNYVKTWPWQSEHLSEHDWLQQVMNKLDWYDYSYVDNFEFTGSFQIIDSYKTSGSIYIRMESLTTPRMITGMMYTEFINMCKNAKIDRGIVNGIWTFAKRGQAIGLKYLGEMPEDDNPRTESV